MPTSTVLSQRWTPVTERGKGRRDTCRGKEMDCHAGLQNAENARSLAYRDDPAFIPELDFVMELEWSVDRTCAKQAVLRIQSKLIQKHSLPEK